MKKSMKSICAFALAMLMVAVMMPVTAFAASEQTITIKAHGQEGIGDDTRFEAYAIFTGEVGSDGSGDQLVGIDWGKGVESSDLVAAMKLDDTLGTTFSSYYSDWESTKKDSMSEPEMVARFLEAHTSEAAYANAFARLAAENLTSEKVQSSKSGNDWTITVPTGYYLIKDTYKSTGGDPDGSVSSYILDVVGPTSIDLKASLPTVEKKVEDGDGHLTETYKDVTFTLTGTVAENIDEYKTYKYVFTDTLSAGLTYSGDSNLSVTIDGTKVKSDSYSVTHTPGTEGSQNILTVTFENLKAAVDESEGPITVSKTSEIVVTYKAKLNKYAEAGDTGNTNSVKLTYSNNPYETADGTSAGDEVKTYTLSLNITKNDKDDEPQQDVGYKLKKGDQYAKLEEQDGHWTVTEWTTEDQATELKTDRSGKGSIFGLETGDYTLVETTPPENYEPMKDVDFTISGGDTSSGDLGEVTAELSTGHEHRDDAEFGPETNGEINLTLKSFTAPVLPHTGGIGAMTVVAVSAFAILGGAFLIFFGLRKKQED